MTTPSTLPIESYPLNPPPLQDLLPILQAGLSKNFAHASVTIVPCPDLTKTPYHLASPGLSGNESIVDIGGPPYLHPFPNFSKRYSFTSIFAQIACIEDERSTSSSSSSITKDDGRGDEKGDKEPRFAIGAGAGPFHLIAQNSELTPNLSVSSSSILTNLTKYTKIDHSSSYTPRPCLSLPVPNSTPEFGLMANLFLSSGAPGPVLHIRASCRTGPLNLTNCLQSTLKSHFGTKTISLGGVFIMPKGRVKCHVMPDFSKTALETEEDVGNWLRFFEWEGRGLVFCATLHSNDPGLGLRGEHTHCFDTEEEDGDGNGKGRGGHYHGDVEETRGVVEYEGYFNVARWIYRVDRPPGS